MDKKYYIEENGAPAGPFSIDELRDKNVTAQTRVFVLGSSGSCPAGELPELADIIVADTPAPGLAQDALLQQLAAQVAELKEDVRRLQLQYDELAGKQGGADAGNQGSMGSTPPPFPGNMGGKDSQIAQTEVEEEAVIISNPPVRKKKPHTSGCLIAMCVLMLVAALAIGIGLLTKASSSSSHQDSDWDVTEATPYDYEDYDVDAEADVEVPACDTFDVK